MRTLRAASARWMTRKPSRSNLSEDVPENTSRSRVRDLLGRGQFVIHSFESLICPLVPATSALPARRMSSHGHAEAQAMVRLQLLPDSVSCR